MPDLYLSRLTLPLRSRATIRLLGDCHAMHRLVMSGFPDVADEAARSALGVLFRVEHPRQPDVRVLVQSGALPRWMFESRSIRADGPEPLDPFLSRIETGERFRFRLHANPTRRVHARAAMGPDAREKPGAVGKRVAVRGEEERLDWLVRKGSAVGFALSAAKVAPGMDSSPEAYEGFKVARSDPAGLTGARVSTEVSGRQRLTFETCTFEGVLTVTDASALRTAIAAGIGPGKAFGCGLLSLARA